MSLRFDHTWVEAYLGFANYRGVTDTALDPAWVPFDPSFQQLQGNGAVDVFSASGLAAQTVIDQFELSPSTMTVTDTYRTMLFQQLAAAEPSVDPYQLIWRLDNIPEALSLAPGSLPYPVIAILNTATELDDADRHKVRIQATGLNILLPVSTVAGQRLTLSYEAATPSDEALITTYGGIYETPPYLVNVRPVLRVSGATVATGSPIGLGQPDSLVLQYSKGNTIGSTTSTPVLAVGIAAITVAAPDVSSSTLAARLAALRASPALVGTPGFDDDATLGEALSVTGAYFWFEGAKQRCFIARSMRMNCAPTVPAAITVMVLPSVFVSGTTIVQLDSPRPVVDLRGFPGAPVLPTNWSPAPPFSAWYLLDGEAMSAMERDAVQTVWSTPAVSTVSVMQSARQAGMPVYTITPANRTSLVPLLSQLASTIAYVNASLDQGRTVVIPQARIQIGQWLGTGWKALDPITGAATFWIEGGFGGASLTEVAAHLRGLVWEGILTQLQADIIYFGLFARIHLPDGRITRSYLENGQAFV